MARVNGPEGFGLSFYYFVSFALWQQVGDDPCVPPVETPTKRGTYWPATLS
jgi:hypothetical protein